MKSKHDNLNTGFEDVVNFCEPEMREASETRPLTLLEKSLTHEPRNLLEGILLNNLRAFLAHLLVMLLGFIPAVIAIRALDVIGAEALFLLFLVVPFLGGCFVYTWLGYRFLKPLTTSNFLSVIIFAAMLFAMSITMLLFGMVSAQAGLPFDSALEILIIVPNFWYNLVILMTLVISGELFFAQSFNHITHAMVAGAMLLASLVPPIFTYLGLCIKVWRRSTSNNGQTLPREEAGEVIQHD